MNDNGLQMYYDRDFGNLLDLSPMGGRDYDNHRPPAPHDWVEACIRGEALEATVLVQQQENTNNKDATAAAIERESIQLTADDIVVLNGSVHGGSDADVAQHCRSCPMHSIIAVVIVGRGFRR
jgi:hypothetical protein